MPSRRRRGNVNGATPSEFSFGRGARPSLGLYPQPNEELDPLATKRAIMQTNPADPNAPLDFEGTYVAYDDYGRQLPTMQERGHTPIVKESGRGEMDDVLDPLNPKEYADYAGDPKADPNEAWRTQDEADPIRTEWEEGQFDPATNERTAAYQLGSSPSLIRQSNLSSDIANRGKRRIVKRVGGPKNNLPWKGEVDPRELDD